MAEALKEAVERLTKLTFDTEAHYGSEKLGWMVGDVPTDDLRTILAALSAKDEALKPFADIAARYPTGGLQADIQQRSPDVVRRLHAAGALAARGAGQGEANG